MRSLQNNHIYKRILQFNYYTTVTTIINTLDLNYIFPTTNITLELN